MNKFICLPLHPDGGVLAVRITAIRNFNSSKENPRLTKIILAGYNGPTAITVDMEINTLCQTINKLT